MQKTSGKKLRISPGKGTFGGGKVGSALEHAEIPNMEAPNPQKTRRVSGNQATSIQISTTDNFTVGSSTPTSTERSSQGLSHIRVRVETYPNETTKVGVVWTFPERAVLRTRPRVHGQDTKRAHGPKRAYGLC